MAKLLTGLSYAKPENLYAGQPVAEIKALNSTLDVNYKNNRANADKLEMLAFNTKVLNKDEGIKNDAFNAIGAGLNDFEYGGDWENADEKVRGLAKDFAMNESLLLAKQNKSARDSGIKDLQSAVKDGKIPKQWMNHEIMKSDENYQGVQLNEETGVFEGSYGITRPADYIDIGKEMWDYAKTVKEDGEPLYLTQPDGTRKYIVHNEQGYVYEGGEVAVSPQKIQSALRGMIMSNTEYKNQIKYENDIIKSNLTRTGIDGAPHRALGTDDIKGLVDNGTLSQEDLDIALSAFGEGVTVSDVVNSGGADGLFDAILYGKKVDSYINPASTGLSYSKVDIASKKDWMKEDAIKYQRKKAEELEETNKSKETLILSSYGNKIRNPTELNTTIEGNGRLGIENEMNDLNSTVKTQEQQIVNNYKILDNDKATAEEIQIAKRSNEDLLAKMNTNKNRLDYLNEVNTTQYYKHLYEGGKITKDDYAELTTGKSPRLDKLNESRRNLNDLSGGKFNINLNDFQGVQQYSLSELEALAKDPNKKGIAKTLANVKFGNPKLDKNWGNWIANITNNRDKTSLINNIETKKAYLDVKEAEAYETAVFDFSTNVKNPEKLSYISQTLSNHVVRNKNAYIITGQDGAQAEALSEDSPYYNQNSIEVTGMTDYVPGRGYVLKGTVRLQETNTKTGKLEFTGENHEILLQPREGNQEARMLIQQALRKDYSRWDKSNENATYGNGIDLANAILRDEIEAQSDKFRRTKIYEGEKQNQEYFLGEDLNAHVTKQMTNGKEFYSVFLEKFDTKRTMLAGDDDEAGTYTAMGKAEKIVFNDLVSLENALEKIKATNGNLPSKNIDKSKKRSVRNNNPLAMTTSVARSLGFTEGKEYTNEGDNFSSSDGSKSYTTATFDPNSDPVETLVSRFDELATSGKTNIFTTSDGKKPRWSYLEDMFGKVFTNEDWANMTTSEKHEVIKKMSIREGGSNVFNL